MSDELDPLPDPVSYHELDRIGLLGCRFVSYRTDFHRRVASMPPRIATWVFLTFVALYKCVVSFLRRVAPGRWTDADPYKYIYVDPSDIEHATERNFSKRRGWVVDGPWDKKRISYMNRPNPRAIEQRFVQGCEWEDTVLAKKYDREEFIERSDAIERLYRQIRDEGYKSQCELLSESPEAAWNDLNDAMHPLANEIAVDIGRNGELLWNICGQHRLAIAKVLDIDRIPVQVFRRHAKWQGLRNAAREGKDLPESVRDHPDLQDVLDD
ncbi:hypothetical protein JCM18237_14790 [Halorubrum luteum]